MDLSHLTGVLPFAIQFFTSKLGTRPVSRSSKFGQPWASLTLTHLLSSGRVMQGEVDKQ
jgi:hypothetical protein